MIRFFTISSFLFSNIFFVAFGRDCSSVHYTLSGDSDMPVRLDRNGDLTTNGQNEYVTKLNKKNLNNQSIEFKSGFAGEDYSPEPQARDKVSLEKKDDGTKILTYNLDYETRSKAFKNRQQAFLYDKKNQDRYAYVTSEKQVIMKGEKNDCYVEQVLKTITATDNPDRKFTDVLYDKTLCTKIDQLQMDDQIPLKQCSDKLLKAGNIMSARAKELKAEGKYLNINDIHITKNPDPDPANDLYSAFKTLTSCDDYTRPRITQAHENKPQATQVEGK